MSAKVGINWTGTRDLAIVKNMIDNNYIDFVEILIDNFLNCNIDTILNVLKDTPCAFHIMNSRFLDNDIDFLELISKSVKKLAEELNPIYISDHVGRFYYQGFCLPQMLEIDYLADKNKTIKRLNIWQDLLKSQILIENYPSVFYQEVGQADFYSDIINATDCALLFDISNAIIAQHNTAYNISHWFDLAHKTKNFHVAGYATCGIPSHDFLVDTHNCAVTDSGLQWVEYFLSNKDDITLSVERDANFNEEEWLSDTLKVRRVINDHG